MYLAAIEHRLHPQLLGRDADFFTLQLQATIFDKVIAALVRLSHLPLSVVVLAVHLLTIFAILAATLRLARRCFPAASAAWCATTLMAVMLTLPVAGTALYLVDQNLHPRAIATALILFAAESVLRRRYIWALLLALLALLFHPIMGALGFSFCFFLAMPWRHLRTTSAAGMLLAVPGGWLFEPPSATWRAAVNTRDYYFLTRWAWYEWLGAIAPIAILLWFAWLGRRRQRAAMVQLAWGTALYAVFQLLVALCMALPPALERLRPLQPMRYLHLVYVVMLLLGGGLLGEHLLRQQRWRWLVLFVPAALGMFAVQRATYPASPHLELPGMHSSNPWLEAFAWIRRNTPQDAYFAIGPDYLHRPDEDSHGFRALALRSVLADNGKDSAVATQVPRLAERWQREVDAQHTVGGDWQHATMADLQRLQSEFGITWVILERPTTVDLPCPYQNRLLAVCRLK